MDRGAWRATVHGVAKSWTRLSDFTHSVGKNLPANEVDTRAMGSIPGSGISPGGENGNALQYSCLENAMDRGDWWATVYGVTKIQTQLTKHEHACQGWECGD